MGKYINLLKYLICFPNLLELNGQTIIFNSWITVGEKMANSKTRESKTMLMEMSGAN